MTRPTLYGNRHAIAAGHYLAATAGLSILEAGGNAVDAGCCAGIALSVLHPDEVSFGGVAPIIIRLSDGRVTTIAGLGHWPRSIPADIFLREHEGRMPFGVLRTVVPAAPDAWITALKRFGTMSFGDVAAAAIEYARDGFAVDRFLEGSFREHERHHRKWSSSTSLFLPGDRPPRLGERFVQADLAATIQFMADQEKAASATGRAAGLEAARDAFYRGDIADCMVAHMKDHGGFLTRADLAGYASRVAPPVSGRWRAFELYTCGPWCQGPTLIQCLKLLEKAGVARLPHNSPRYLHLLAEAVKCVFADREYHYGDPDHVHVPLDRLHSERNAAEWLARISPRQAMQDVPLPNGPVPAGSASSVAYAPADGTPDLYPDTSYVCAIDRWGNAFSATPSDGTQAPVVEGLGFVPSTRGTQSRTDPAHPGGIGPGRRPRLTPSPALAVRDDGAVVSFGTPGGDAMIQAMVQVFLNAFLFGMDIQAAIEAPRVVSHSFPSWFHPNKVFPAYLVVEDGIPEPVRRDLAARGHRIDLRPGYSRNGAAVELIVRHPAPGFLRAGADPRHVGYALVR